MNDVCKACVWFEWCRNVFSDVNGTVSFVSDVNHTVTFVYDVNTCNVVRFVSLNDTVRCVSDVINTVKCVSDVNHTVRVVSDVNHIVRFVSGVNDAVWCETVTDKCPSWISGGERVAIEIISWPNLYEGYVAGPRIEPATSIPLGWCIWLT